LKAIHRLQLGNAPSLSRLNTFVLSTIADVIDARDCDHIARTFHRIGVDLVQDFLLKGMFISK